MTFLEDKLILVNAGSRLESTAKLVEQLEEGEDESLLDSQGAEGNASSVQP